ncbi:hypothetical protein RIF29_29989 [Crotalaria pallida]|uniref:CG-1 domain-containing protein n=1 Tax=Crotalaria pallida TaxID=3830 RepID=A0AAN9EFV3_CROPI
MWSWVRFVPEAHVNGASLTGSIAPERARPWLKSDVVNCNPSFGFEILWHNWRKKKDGKTVKEAHEKLKVLVQRVLDGKRPNKKVDSTSASTLGEESLLDSILETLTSKDESSTYAFLDGHHENESCKKLLTMWNFLKPSTQRVLSLVAEVKSLENDKENLRINLDRAEEVKVLFDKNGILDEKNKSLARHCKERNHLGSGGKLTSSISAKVVKF